MGCLTCPDGNHVLVASLGGDPAIIGSAARPGGLDIFDLRKLSTDLGEDCCSSAHVGQRLSEKGKHNGVVDVALAPQGFESLAVTLMDGIVQVFRIGSSGPVISDRDPFLPMESSQTLSVSVRSQRMDPSPRMGLESSVSHPKAPVLAHEFTSDVVERYEHHGVKPCAVATSGRYVFIATTNPALGVWRRMQVGETGKQEPLSLASRIVPQRVVPRTGYDFDEKPMCDENKAPYGTVLGKVQEALARDRFKALAFTAK